MKIVYLSKTYEDLEWFYFYYEKVFFAGKNNAQKSFYSIEEILEKNPNIGVEINKGLRKLKIPKTPFSLIYRLNSKENVIEVLRVWDDRKNPKKTI